MYLQGFWIYIYPNLYAVTCITGNTATSPSHLLACPHAHLPCAVYAAGKGTCKHTFWDEIDHHDTWRECQAMQGRAVWAGAGQLASQSSILLWIESIPMHSMGLLTLRVNSGNSYEKWVRTQQRGEGRVVTMKMAKQYGCGCCIR